MEQREPKPGCGDFQVFTTLLLQWQNKAKLIVPLKPETPARYYQSGDSLHPLQLPETMPSVYR